MGTQIFLNYSLDLVDALLTWIAGHSSKIRRLPHLQTISLSLPKRICIIMIDQWCMGQRFGTHRSIDWAHADNRLWQEDILQTATKWYRNALDQPRPEKRQRSTFSLSNSAIDDINSTNIIRQDSMVSDTLRIYS